MSIYDIENQAKGKYTCAVYSQYPINLNSLTRLYVDPSGYVWEQYSNNGGSTWVNQRKSSQTIAQSFLRDYGTIVLNAIPPEGGMSMFIASPFGFIYKSAETNAYVMNRVYGWC